MDKVQLACVLAIGILLLSNQPARAQTQTKAYSPPPEFAALLLHFQQRDKMMRQFGPPSNPLYPPLLAEQTQARVGMNYQVKLGSKPLGLQKREVVLKNPFGASAFPLSYSIIYQGHLVALFDPGSFACYNLKTLMRNQALEQRLNQQLFQYHWLLDNQLVGLSGGQYFVLTAAGTWAPYTKPVPFLARQPKLFEDERYLSFLTCNGEFGGKVYFYDKRSGRYYLTGATCPNSITKHAGKYWVLSSLGHMMGSADVQVIDDPTKLTHRLPAPKPASAGVAPLVQSGSTAPQEKRHTSFDYYGIQLFSSFVRQGQLLYVVNLADRTFLATIENDRITVVDPLFDNHLYTHNPITTRYGPDLTLMNMDFYGLGRDKEVSCLLFTGKQVVRIDWGQKFDLRNGQ